MLRLTSKEKEEEDYQQVFMPPVRLISRNTSALLVLVSTGRMDTLPLKITKPQSLI